MKKRNPQNRFRRKLTPFLCKEMLYDYATNRLDSERREAVSEFIENDKESQSILEAIRKGIECADLITKSEVKPEILTQLHEAETAISLGKKYSSWKEWPESFRWSVSAIGTSAVLALIIAIVPWNKLPTLQKKQASNTIEIAQIPTSDGKLVLDSATANQEGAGAEEGSGDEAFDGASVATNSVNGMNSVNGTNAANVATNIAGKVANGGSPINAVSGPKAAPNQQKPVEIAKAPPVEPQKLAVKAVSMQSQSESPSNDGEEVPISSSAEAVAVTVPDTNGVPPSRAENLAVDSQAKITTKDNKQKGFVFRAFMNISNLEELAPKITASIVDLGGQKAGEVELGWRRGSGRYYHFTMPESNHDKLMESLRAYGPVRISKDPHPRVMPEGQVRFILWVEALN